MQLSFAFLYDNCLVRMLVIPIGIHLFLISLTWFFTLNRCIHYVLGLNYVISLLLSRCPRVQLDIPTEFKMSLVIMSSIAWINLLQHESVWWYSFDLNNLYIVSRPSEFKLSFDSSLGLLVSICIT